MTQMALVSDYCLSHQVCINCLKKNPGQSWLDWLFKQWSWYWFEISQSHCAFLFIVVGFHHCLDYGFHLFYMCSKSKWHKVKLLGAKAAVVRVKT